MARGAPPLFHLMTSGRTIRRGARGSAVQELQQFLTDQGFELEPDGIFGPKTRAAVRAFQEANGLSADGEVGQKTRAAIAAMMQAQREPPPEPHGQEVPAMGGQEIAAQPGMPVLPNRGIPMVPTEPVAMNDPRQMNQLGMMPVPTNRMVRGAVASTPSPMTLPGQFPAGMHGPKRPGW